LMMTGEKTSTISVVEAVVAVVLCLLDLEVFGMICSFEDGE